MHWETRLLERAAGQHGLLARFHLRELGCGSWHWQRAISRGRWEELSPRVLRMRGAPAGDEQRALAGVFDASPGAFLHGRTALGWFGLQAFNLSEIHVVRFRGMSGKPATLAQVHRLRDVRPHHVVVVRGVPTERPLRAIWVEAARYATAPLYEIGVRKIGRLLDDAHVRRLVSWMELHEMVNDIRERGRSGTVIMRHLAQARPPGSSPTESKLEDRFEEVLRAGGVRLPRRQISVGGLEQIGRCDFADADHPLVIEVNSEQYHTSPSDIAADELRYRRLNDAGFVVAVIWESDLWRRPSAVRETVESARGSASHRQIRVIHSAGCPWPQQHAA